MSEFIEVTKKGEENIFIHPDALEDHKRLGWKVVERTAVAVETVPEEATGGAKPETAKERRAREKRETEEATGGAVSDDGAVG